MHEVYIQEIKCIVYYYGKDKIKNTELNSNESL